MAPELTRNSIFTFEARPSDSPFVDVIWRSTSGSNTPAAFMSVAESHWGIVITRQYGKTTFTVRGPETIATPSPVPENAEFMGISFKLGTFMPFLPASNLVDGAVNLPDASSQKFYLNGSAWQLPDFENVDTFIERLVRQDMLAREPVVQAALQGHFKEVSLRSVQRRFLRVTGLSHTTIYQIERARRALALLEQGVSISDTVDLAGYADQPHLTRALRRYVGHTPAQIAATFAVVNAVSAGVR